MGLIDFRIGSMTNTMAKRSHLKFMRPQSLQDKIQEWNNYIYLQ